MKRLGKHCNRAAPQTVLGAKTNNTFVIKVVLGETLFAHYSNALIAEQNLAINAIIIMVGKIDWNVEI